MRHADAPIITLDQEHVAWHGDSWISGLSWPLVCVVIMVVTVLPADRSLGQVGLPPSIDPSGRSGLPPPVQRQHPLAPKESPSEVLPPLESAPEELKEKGPALHVYVREIRVIGSTVLSSEELRQITAPYKDREITSEDLEDVRSLLTMAYDTRHP